MLDTTRLIALRKSSKLTQAEVAKKLNTSRPNYVRYERGNHQPPNETLSMLADLFNVTTDYLLGQSDDPSPPSHKKEAPATFEEVEEAYIKMLAEEEGTSVDGLELSEDRRRQLRRVILSLLSE